MRFEARKQRLQWGSLDYEVPIKHLVKRHLHHRSSSALRCDASLLLGIAGLALKKKVELVWHLETQLEYLGLRKATGVSSAFYGAPIGVIQGPVRYSRTLIDGSGTLGAPEQLTVQFLEAINVSRYLELKRLTNAQPASKHYVNQLLDAFHIWCAESSNSAVFLTTDYTLIRLAAKSPSKPQSLRLLTPRGLMLSLAMERRLTVWEMLEALGSFSYRLTTSFWERPVDVNLFGDVA